MVLSVAIFTTLNFVGKTHTGLQKYCNCGFNVTFQGGLDIVALLVLKQQFIAAASSCTENNASNKFLMSRTALIFGLMMSLGEDK